MKSPKSFALIQPLIKKKLWYNTLLLTYSYLELGMLN